jgi:hypothetical protein
MLKKAVELSEYEVIFKIGRSLKFFVYHMLFFSFGIFSVPIFICFEGLPMAFNMGFLGCSLSSVTQYLAHLSFSISIILYISNDLPNVDPEEILFMGVAITIRSMIIAIRYGFSNDERIHIMKSFRKTTEFLSADFLLRSFAGTFIKSLDVELEATLWRNQIEGSQFSFNFMEELSEFLK